MEKVVLDEELAQRKYAALTQRLRALGSLALGFSGGVDSALLGYAARQVLGEGALALTVLSPFLPRQEAQQAQALAREIGLTQVTLTADVLSRPEIATNPKDRCYYCKKYIFGLVRAEAIRRSFFHVADGTNADDTLVYRPGRRALSELGVLSPLAESGLTKAEIRYLAQTFALSVWAKPALACLATRFPYGTMLTQEALECVAAAEEYLNFLGFTGCRVRAHGVLARIEVPEEEIMRLCGDSAVRQAVLTCLKEVGFSFVTADLAGYKTGSFDS